MISKNEVQEKYQKYSGDYDFAVKLYRLLGFRIQAYRIHAVDLLNLKRGDSVVELGCGTGLNFSFLMEKIGPEGRLIGVDITPGMLEVAREKVERSGWKNVELVKSDIALYDLPENINGILSMGVFGYLPENDGIIEKAFQVLVPGGLFVIFDLKRPERWPLWLFRFFVWLASPFGVSADYFRSKSWESIERHFTETTFEERYGGLIYIASGKAGAHTKILVSKDGSLNQDDCQ